MMLIQLLRTFFTIVAVALPTIVSATANHPVTMIHSYSQVVEEHVIQIHPQPELIKPDKLIIHALVTDSDGNSKIIDVLEPEFGGPWVFKIKPDHDSQNHQVTIFVKGQRHDGSLIELSLPKKHLPAPDASYQIAIGEASSAVAKQ